MTQILANVALTSVTLSLVLWVSRTNAALGGFILSLPISTLIALAFSRLQGADPGDTFALAESIFVAMPASLTFFLPFLVAERWKLGFWTAYGSGVGLLTVSFFVHRWVMANWVGRG